MSLPPAILETVLIRLATLFIAGANNDQVAAREAAAQMVAAYQPTTEDELRLAANIVLFSFQAMEALAQAAGPDVPVIHALRLRSGAVSLNREATKAQRQLAQIRSRPEPVAEAPAAPQIKPPGTVAAVAKAKNLTWTQANDERQRELRIAASLKRAEAKIAALALPTPTPQPGTQQTTAG